jgi:hypothetical protein
LIKLLLSFPAIKVLQNYNNKLDGGFMGSDITEVAADWISDYLAQIDSASSDELVVDLRLAQHKELVFNCIQNLPLGDRLVCWYGVLKNPESSIAKIFSFKRGLFPTSTLSGVLKKVQATWHKDEASLREVFEFFDTKNRFIFASNHFGYLKQHRHFINVVDLFNHSSNTGAADRYASVIARYSKRGGRQQLFHDFSNTVYGDGTVARNVKVDWTSPEVRRLNKPLEKLLNQLISSTPTEKQVELFAALLGFLDIFACEPDGEDKLSLMDRAYLSGSSSLAAKVYEYVEENYSRHVKSLFKEKTPRFVPGYFPRDIDPTISDFIFYMKDQLVEDSDGLSLFWLLEGGAGDSSKAAYKIEDTSTFIKQQITLFKVYVDGMEPGDEKNRLILHINNPAAELGKYYDRYRKMPLQEKFPEASYEVDCQASYDSKYYNNRVSMTDAYLSRKIYAEAMCQPNDSVQPDLIRQLLNEPFGGFEERKKFVADLLVYNILADRQEVLKMALEWLVSATLNESDLVSCLDLERSLYVFSYCNISLSPLSWAALFDRTKCLDVLFDHQSAEERLQSGVLQEINNLAGNDEQLDEKTLKGYWPYVFAFITCVDHLQDQNERDRFIDIMLSDNQSALKQLVNSYQKEMTERIIFHYKNNSFHLDLQLPRLTSDSVEHRCHYLRLRSPIDMLLTAKNGLSQNLDVCAFQLHERIKSIKITFLQLINGVDPFSNIAMRIFRKEAFIDLLETLPNEVMLDVVKAALYQKDSWPYKVFHTPRGTRAPSTERGQLGRLNKIFQNKVVLLSNVSVIGTHSTLHARRDLAQYSNRLEVGNRFIRNCDL